MNIKIESTWQEALKEEFEKAYFKQLQKDVDNAYKTEDIFPPQDLIFNALNLCPLPNLKVVILGQDPYHGPSQAHGLSFSVPDDVKIPPSLRNIYKELNSDLDLPIPTSGNLEHWAKQGVLLLNATLTVRAGEAGSHQGLGWETFTDEIIKTTSDQKENVVFLLWGKYAQAKAELIDSNKHLILTAPHPSPFSAYTGFFGCKHFSMTNEYLNQQKQNPIAW
jgi:uracil-DNA glycosylase